MDTLRQLLSQSLGLIIEEGVILALIILASILARLILRRIYFRTLKHKGNILSESFVIKLLKPIRTLIWITGVSYMIYVFLAQLSPNFQFGNSFRQFRNVVVVFCATWFAFQIKKQMEFAWIEKKKKKKSKSELDITKANLVGKIISITIITIGGLLFLEALGVKLSALIAFAGVGGLGVSLAAKDVFANYFSGMMIHITRPFSIGDWIHSLDNSLEGTVEEIGYYLTKVRSFDKRPIYVPNATFSSKTIVNASRMSNRRIKHLIGVRYQDIKVVPQIVNDIRNMLKNHEEIDQGQHLLVDFYEYGPSSLNILIYTFSKTTVWKEWLRIQEDVLLKVGEIIHKHEADIAFPTTTLDFPKDFLPKDPS